MKNVLLLLFGLFCFFDAVGQTIECISITSINGKVTIPYERIRTVRTLGTGSNILLMAGTSITSEENVDDIYAQGCGQFVKVEQSGVPLLVSMRNIESATKIGTGAGVSIKTVGSSTLIKTSSSYASFQSEIAACSVGGGGGGGTPSWELDGNGGTGNVLGTIDDTPLIVITDNVERIKIGPAANVVVFPNQANEVITSDKSTVLGGVDNVVTNTTSGSILTGRGNHINSLDVIEGASILGGINNSVESSNSSIVNGSTNRIYDSSSSIIVGGEQNTIQGLTCFIGGGAYNSVNGETCVIVGGGGNTVTGVSNAMLTGNGNTLAGDYNSIVGGESNSISSTSQYGFIGGGRTNTLNTQVADGGNSSILGGKSNAVFGSYGVIAGGKTNQINLNSDYSFIGAGENNTVAKPYSSVICGSNNLVESEKSAIVCGQGNLVSQDMVAVTSSAILAGTTNQVANDNSVVLNGIDNNVLSKNSVAMGNSAVSSNKGEVVHANGRISMQGDAQAVELILTGVSTGTGDASLTLDFATTAELVQFGHLNNYVFSGTMIVTTVITSIGNGSGSSNTFHSREVGFCVRNIGGTLTSIAPMGSVSPTGKEFTDMVVGYTTPSIAISSGAFKVGVVKEFFAGSTTVTRHIAVMKGTLIGF